jgi:ubiquinone/menaquinone biosynthesis C-methylase UbiE
LGKEVLADKWAKKKKIKFLYDSGAKVYNIQYFAEQMEKYAKALKYIKFKSNEIILDAGCGTGLFEEIIRNKENSIFCVDISSQMLTIAKSRLRDYNNIFLINADVDHLPFLNSSFDVSIAFTVIQNVPNPVRSIKELNRVLKSGGLSVISCPKKKMELNDFKSLLKKNISLKR